RRGGREALLEPVLRDREEELGGGAEAPHEGDQELDLLLGAVVLLAEERGHGLEHLRGRAALVVEEVRDELVRHHAEHVGHRRLVAAEADRRGEGGPSSPASSTSTVGRPSPSGMTRERGALMPPPAVRPPAAPPPPAPPGPRAARSGAALATSGPRTRSRSAGGAASPGWRTGRWTG